MVEKTIIGASEKIKIFHGEDKIKELFGDLYMGGGGHAGAVSFRIHSLEEKELLAQLEILFAFFNDAMESN